MTDQPLILDALQTAYWAQYENPKAFDARIANKLALALRELMGDKEFLRWQLENKTRWSKP
jgi:hypothetical protein